MVMILCCHDTETDALSSELGPLCCVIHLKLQLSRSWLQEGANTQEQEALASELGLMCAAGRHRHCLQICAGVINSQGTVVGILTELMAGNLHDLINQWCVNQT